MRSLVTWLGAGAAALFALAAVGSRAPRALGDDAPQAPADVLAEAMKLVDAARAAKPKADPEIVEGAKKAVDMLRAAKKQLSGRGEFPAAWNDALTVARYRGATFPQDEYAMVPTEMLSHRIRFGLPAGVAWSYEPHHPDRNDQLWGVISKKVGGDRILCEVKIWIYRWDTVYSGIGGENVKGMAESNLDYDRSNMAVVKSRSPRILALPLSKSFPRANYYELVGEDLKLGPVRRRNFYVKGITSSFNFEVVEHRKPDPKDDDFRAWLAAGDDPEVDAVLKSIEDTSEEAAKAKKKK